MQLQPATLFCLHMQTGTRANHLQSVALKQSTCVHAPALLCNWTCCDCCLEPQQMCWHRVYMQQACDSSPSYVANQDGECKLQLLCHSKVVLASNGLLVAVVCYCCCRPVPACLLAQFLVHRVCPWLVLCLLLGGTPSTASSDTAVPACIACISVMSALIQSALSNQSVYSCCV